MNCNNALPNAGISICPRILNNSEIQRNPFFLLGVSTRDNKKRIVELAEEKSLEIDYDLCQKARADLTSPRNRLIVELSWLPGVSPKKAEQLTDQLLRDPMSIRAESGLPTLAHANLMAVVFDVIDVEDNPADVSEFIKEMAYLVDLIKTQDVIRDINEDRSVSGFPEVHGQEQIETELAERNRYFKNIIIDALNRLPSSSLIKAMTLVVNDVTIGGEIHAPALIDGLVDSYEIESQGFLQKEAENIKILIETAEESASSNDDNAMMAIIDQLEVIIRNWGSVAKPIQLSAKARGLEHELSNTLAYSMRSLAIDLFNDHDMSNQTKRIASLIQELFSENREIIERVEQDTDVLQEILEAREQAANDQTESTCEITYQAEIGVMFKNTLSISPNGITWKGKHYAQEAITRVRWGGVKRSINGIPTGTNYIIAFGDNRSETIVDLRRKEVYLIFINKLWNAVCVQLFVELLGSLKSGEEIRFGDALLKDDGITLVKHKFWGVGESVHCLWDQVQIWNSDGDFYIGMTDDKKTYVGLSYIEISNIHVLERAIRMAFEKPGIKLLSDLLQ